MAKLLLVEDHYEIWDFLSRLLRRRGFDVVLAHDGQAAIDGARTHRPDLILLDMNLPVIDGWTVAGTIKADPLTRGIPIIALTAHALSTDRDRVIAAGCDDYHSKPLDFSSLLSQIEAQMARATGAAT